MCAGLVPHVICGETADGVDLDLAIEGRILVAWQIAPGGERQVPARTGGRVSSAGEVIERRLIGRDDPDLRSELHREVAQRHAALDRHRRDGAAGVLDGEAGAAIGTVLADQVQHQVLRLDPAGEAARAGDAHLLGAALDDRLRREHVREVAAADAPAERTEAAVRARVAVAAQHGYPRQRQPELGTDDVHDALLGVVEVEKPDAFGVCPLAQRGQRACGPRSLSASVRPTAVETV